MASDVRHWAIFRCNGPDSQSSGTSINRRFLPLFPFLVQWRTIQSTTALSRELKPDTFISTAAGFLCYWRRHLAQIPTQSMGFTLSKANHRLPRVHWPTSGGRVAWWRSSWTQSPPFSVRPRAYRLQRELYFIFLCKCTWSSSGEYMYRATLSNLPRKAPEGWHLVHFGEEVGWQELESRYIRTYAIWVTSFTTAVAPGEGIFHKSLLSIEPKRLHREEVSSAAKLDYNLLRSWPKCLPHLCEPSNYCIAKTHRYLLNKL